MHTLLRQVRVEHVTDAPPEAVWAIVGDPTRTGEWSHECRRLEWVDGATAAVPGARFRGRNRRGRSSWSRLNEVQAVEPGRSITWRTIPGRLYRDSTIWRIEVEPVDGGTRIVQSYDIVMLGPVMDRLLAIVAKPHRDRRAALTADLVRIGEVAARSTTGTISPPG
jgi:uncharacterized protein YndB with AHSA1/START domain